MKLRLALSLLIIVVLFGARLAVQQARALSDPAPPMHITAAVVKREIEDALVAPGTVQSAEPIGVRSPVGGRVMSLWVAPGDTVRRGQRIAQIASSPDDGHPVDVFSPADGTVSAVATAQGRPIADAGDGSLLLSVLQASTASVRVPLSSEQAAGLASGQHAYFNTGEAPGIRIDGTLRSIDPLPLTEGGTARYSGLVDVADPDHRLPASLAVMVCIVRGQAWGALTIPRGALGERADDGSYPVHVIDAEGRQASRSVRIGLMNQVTVQVREGLREREQVVLQPLPQAAARSPLLPARAIVGTLL